MNTLRGITHLLLITGIILGVAACSSIKSDPEQVIKEFYKAANEGKYNEAKQYLSQEGIRNIEGPIGARAGGLKGILDKYTRNGNLEKVDVREVSIRGDGASCKVTKYFKDKGTKELMIEFIMENGAWKISWSTSTL